MASSAPTRDLFDDKRPKPRKRTDLVTVPLHVMGEGTDKAWFLSADGTAKTARWAPKRLVSRGEGRDANLFTMPHWVAEERGWL